jgi:hypothetical protein
MLASSRGPFFFARGLPLGGDLGFFRIVCKDEPDQAYLLHFQHHYQGVLNDHQNR